MEVEHIEIRDFLLRYPPFDTLPEDTLNHVASHTEVAYFKAGSRILEFGQTIHDLYVVRSGAVELYRRNGELYNRLSEGAIFGNFGLLMNGRTRFPATALEDTLVYFVPERIFHQLCDQYETFSDYVELENTARLRQAVSEVEHNNELMTAAVSKLLARELITLSVDATVHEAAQQMKEDSVSSLLLLNPDGSMAGIITDRDLRTRFIAPRLPFDTPIKDIMSTDLISVDRNDRMFEAMLMMLRHNVHHLPVLHGRKPIGMLALSDLVRHESKNSLFVVGSIFHKNTVEELQMLQNDVKASFVRMVNEDANSRMIGSAMAVIGRSFKQRLLELAEETLGPAPIPYCFLALGSMAREEQLIVTDQDNALILDNRFDPAVHDEYFQKLAQFVSDGLAACGYSYCTGEIMATNPKWRKPLKDWEAMFHDWIDNPKAEALLHSSIFFDLDGVWGETDWVEQLKTQILREAPASPRFLAYLARNALNRTPPLGFFKNFVMEQDGKHNNSINLKRRGTAPLADLIRVHALAVGSREQNSFERLNDIMDTKVLPEGGGPNLRDAMEFISMVRIRHQALDLEAGREPDNNIEPDSLSHFERRNLKDAFQVVINAQTFLKFRYQPKRSS